MKNIIIITGPELKHVFFRQFLSLSENINVINSYCQMNETNPESDQTHNITTDLQGLPARQQAAHDYFEQLVKHTPDHSNPVQLSRAEINSEQFAQKVMAARPDLIIAYGCTIVSESLLDTCQEKLLHAHIGVAPYYQGSKFYHWPTINHSSENSDENVMFIDVLMDTGKIIHQIRAKYFGRGKFTIPYNQLIVNMLIV